MKENYSVAVQNVSIFGLGKLGAVIAGCYASRGFRVIGVDVDGNIVKTCNLGVPPVEETGIEDLYRSSAALITATMDGRAAVRQSEATLIAVPTPSDSDGGYSLKYVREACQTIGDALRDKNTYHLVVLKSTVLPGSCDNQIVPMLEARSRKKCGVDFGFCYNPEFIALGSVIYNIFNPDLILIGESDRDAGERLLEICNRLMEVKHPTARMNLVNAELAKLSVNSYVTMKITFANLLARVCEQLPGGDVDVVTAALGLDARIGSKYLKGGLGYGGPCFPRDNEAMLCLARRLGVSFPLAQATDQANHEIAGQVADIVEANVPAGARIGILGLSYKPNTAVTDESQGVLIAGILLDRGFTVVAYDPLAMHSARGVFGDRISYAESTQACILEADAVLITTAWDEFKRLSPLPRNGSKTPVIIDCWGILEDAALPSSTVIRLGKTLPAAPGHHPPKSEELVTASVFDGNELER
jgi:UDPglucose 6-dehydrogenase